MMTTEQVSTKSYFVYDTYERILSNKSVQPIWVEYLNDYTWYRDAPAGSTQRKIWDQSVAIHEKDPNRSPLIKCEPTNMLNLGTLALNQRIVVFLTNMFHSLFLGGMCLALPGIPGYNDLRFKVTKDTNLKSSLYALPMSTHSKTAPIFESISIRLLQHGLLSDPQIIAELKDYIATTLPNKAHFDENYFECLEYENFPTKDPKTLPLDLPNFHTLLYFYGTALLFVLVVFFIERFSKPPKKNVRR